MTPLYPLFLKVAGKRAVVVGGGRIGLHKAAELAHAGAHVVVISETFANPDAAADARSLEPGAAAARFDVAAAPGVRVERVQRRFTAGDTTGAFIVVAATGDPSVDDAVAADARAHGALVNVVDVAEASDFYSGAVVRRGPVTVVVGTSGASPALARKVRMRIEQVLPEELAVLADVLGAARPKLLARFPVFAERARVLDAFVDAAWRRFLGTGTRDVRNDIERAVTEELLCTSS